MKSIYLQPQGPKVHVYNGTESFLCPHCGGIMDKENPMVEYPNVKAEVEQISEIIIHKLVDYRPMCPHCQGRFNLRLHFYNKPVKTMPKTTFDEDGYPTDETLENIKQWPHKDSFNGLVEYVQGAWNHGYGYMIQGDGKFTLVTGGWSGNESIVDALLENPLFWAKYWKASFRGGSFDFDLPK